MADDTLALENVSHDRELTALATTREAVSRLWDVCQVPDYRKISTQDHAELVATLYKFIMGPEGRIPVDWFAKQVAFADRTDGDIDTLATRIAHIRTWTFVSNRADWLADPEHWQGRTRAIEDSLSDALHEQLTQRFIDRRTSALMRGLKEKDELFAEIADDGAVQVEKHFVGRLQGFRFFPDTQAEGIHGKATRNAAAHVLAKELAMRARRVASAKSDAFKLTRRGQVLWRDDEIARLEAGDDPLKPVVAVTADEHLSAPDKEKVQGAARRMDRRNRRRAVEAAGGDCRCQGHRGTGARHCLSAQRELRRAAPGGGGGGNARARSAGAGATAQLRRAIRRLQYLFPGASEAGVGRAGVVLWALKNGATHGIDMAAMPDPPRPGLTSLVADKAVPEAFYRVTGFHVCGPRAVRIDMLERLADQIRPLMAWRANPANPNPPPKGATGDGGFRATPEMMSILGCSAGELGNVLQALGFRLDRVRIEPDPAKPADAVANGESTVAPSGRSSRPGRRAGARRPNSRPDQQPPTAPDPTAGRQRGSGVRLRSSLRQTRRHRKSNGMKSGGLVVRDASPSSTGETPTRARSRTVTGRRNPSPARTPTRPERSNRPDRRERRRDGPAQRRDDRPRAVRAVGLAAGQGRHRPRLALCRPAVRSRLALEKPSQD